MNRRSILFAALILLISFNSLLEARKTPSWVKQRPIDKDYYIGVGVAPKMDETHDYIQIAKDDALKNLASEIKVNIQSSVISKVVETSGILEEQIRAEIQSTTQAELEDYELVDIFDDKDDYWIYYRLSKEQYLLKKKQKLDKAIALALDFFTRAESKYQENMIGEALLFYVQALAPVQKYLGESLETEYQNRDIYLGNEIYAKLSSILNAMEIQPVRGKMDGKVNKPLADPVEFKALYRKGNNESIPVQSLPLVYGFLRGDGDFVSHSRTGNDGKARSTVSKIKSSDKMQIFQAKVDLASFTPGDSTNTLYLTLLETFNPPEAKVILSISSLTIFLESDETNLGKALTVERMEPRLKENLADRGYTFTQDVSEADIYLTMKAASREGGNAFNMFTAYVDYSLSAVAMDSGQEVYKTSMSKIKGIDLELEKAGLKALDNAAESLVKEVIPDLVDKL